MNRTVPLLLLALAALALAGCVPTYSLVSQGEAAVAAQGLVVQAPAGWNRIPPAPGRIKWEENWTRNGPLLDSLAFIGGLPSGKSLMEQPRKADRKVPTFDASMSPQDLVSMIESHYRIGGISTFEVTGVEPVEFIGEAGVRLDFSYVSADDVKRRGRTVLAVANERLYMVKLEGTASHYFDAAMADFESMVTTARLR
jgi:hypothetical protein